MPNKFQSKFLVDAGTDLDSLVEGAAVRLRRGHTVRINVPGFHAGSQTSEGASLLVERIVSLLEQRIERGQLSRESLRRVRFE